MAKITIHEIAKELNIDSSTVSRALNNSDRVTEKTKKKVLSMAKNLGYQRNLIASNLRTNKTNTIGVVVPRISRHFFSSTIAGIEEAAFASGYNIIIAQSIDKIEREKQIVDNLIANRVDGVLISVSMESGSGEYLEKFQLNNIPLVFFDRYCSGIKESSKVVIDDEFAAFEATSHLIAQGCNKIVYFSGPKSLSIYQDRLKGYKRALKENNKPYNPNLVVKSRLMESDGRMITKKLVESQTEFDGIFAANDVSAIGAMKYLKSIGKKIPKDVAVVGFSNEPVSEVIEPSLSTIDQSGFEIGKIACGILIGKLKDKNVQGKSEKTVILKPTLLERESSKRE